MKIKTLIKFKNREELPRFYIHPAANIRLKCKSLNDFPKIRNKAIELVLTNLFNTVLDVLVTAIRQEKEINVIQMKKKERKMFSIFR